MQLLAPEAPRCGLPGAEADETQPGPCSGPCAFPLGIHCWQWAKIGCRDMVGSGLSWGGASNFLGGSVWSSEVLCGSPTCCHPCAGHILGWRFLGPWPGPAQQLLLESLRSFEAHKSHPAAVAGWISLFRVGHFECNIPGVGILPWTGAEAVAVPAAVTPPVLPLLIPPVQTTSQCPTSSSSVSHPWIFFCWRIHSSDTCPVPFQAGVTQSFLLWLSQPSNHPRQEKWALSWWLPHSLAESDLLQHLPAPGCSQGFSWEF